METEENKKTEMKTILQTVQDDPDLSKLEGALSVLKATDAPGKNGSLYDAVAAALNNKNGKLTLFAPTNAAFAAISNLAINQKELTEILLYHIAAGIHPSNTFITKFTTLKTALGGNPIVVMNEDGKVKVCNASVEKADIVCTNGIIHKIDAVLSPADCKKADTETKTKKVTTK